MARSISVSAKTVGLIVRGKHNDGHRPGVMEQHADCILPNGGPVGFFGGGGDASSGSSGLLFGSSFTSWRDGPSASSNSAGINMKGMVAHYREFKKIRPMYVDIKLAKKYDVRSTVLLFDVTDIQAELFVKYWNELKLKPGAFNLLGGNCSSHASEAFLAANIVRSGIPGLDTPDNLYSQLKTKYATTAMRYSGFVGAAPKGGDKYDLLVE